MMASSAFTSTATLLNVTSEYPRSNSRMIPSVPFVYPVTTVTWFARSSPLNDSWMRWSMVSGSSSSKPERSIMWALTPLAFRISTLLKALCASPTAASISRAASSTFSRRR